MALFPVFKLLFEGLTSNITLTEFKDEFYNIMEKAADFVMTDTATDNLYPALFQCFAIILCGYIAGRLNLVSQTESKGIGTFVGTFALPSLIFLSLARLDFSIVNWKFLLAILLAKGIVFFGVLGVTLLVSKPLNLARAGIFAIFCTQSNDFALGYPIINAIYEKTHPEYALYLYLMAPISLAILNPVAFVLMEITKQRQNQSADGERRSMSSVCKSVKQIVKGIALNPVLAMTVLGILGNVIFKHNLSVYIEGLLNDAFENLVKIDLSSKNQPIAFENHPSETLPYLRCHLTLDPVKVFGQSFSASALFLLGLRMVGQIHRLKGPALLLPCVLIMVKLIILPVVMRECVSSMEAGFNETETGSLSTYAFLYGTIPTAPAVFVFSNLYQLEIDLMASSMVICTFVSAPIMYLSAQVISINKDYKEQLKRFGFDLSIVALIAVIWVIIVISVTKKYKRMPHRLTLCLLASQLLLAISVIWGGPVPEYAPSWHNLAQQAVRTFSIYSCLLWTSMLSVGILMLESRGPCFVLTLFPVLAFVAWGAPAVMVAILLFAKTTAGELDEKCTDAIRLCLLVFCITVSTGCLIVYIRYRRRSTRFASLSADVAGSPCGEETTSLVDNDSVPNGISQSINSRTEDQECYGAITSTPSPNKNGCCSGDPQCTNGINPIPSDIEDMADQTKDCACPTSQKQRCAAESCEYLNELERAASQLGLLPPEQSRGRGSQLLKHTVLLIVYSLSMFIGITYTTWKMMMKDESGVYIEIEFLDIAANYGQGLLMFVLFGLDPDEILIPAVRYFKKKWHGEDTLVLPPVDELSFETKHVCDQFITHHLVRCREDIARDTRWRMRTYHNVFRGSCLVRWLLECGLAKDEHEAIQYGRHLLDGRVISHINIAHHFNNSTLLYTFG